MNKETIHIAFALDDAYTMQTCVAIHSILKFTSRPCRFYILHDVLANSNVLNLLKICRGKADMEFIKVENFDQWMRNNTMWPDATFFRVLLPSLCPSLDKIIYLDCDTLIKGDIAELWDIDITNNTCAVVEDCLSKVHSQRIGKQPYRYFNSGVLLMNLAEWRRNDIAHKVFAELFKYRDVRLKYPDQDILNILLYGTVRMLPTRFNAQNVYFNIDSDEYNFAHPLDLSDPLIIHFTGPEKPWNDYGSLPYHLAWRITKDEANALIESTIL